MNDAVQHRELAGSLGHKTRAKTGGQAGHGCHGKYDGGNWVGVGGRSSPGTTDRANLGELSFGLLASRRVCAGVKGVSKMAGILVKKGRELIISSSGGSMYFSVFLDFLLFFIIFGGGARDC